MKWTAWFYADLRAWNQPASLGLALQEMEYIVSETDGVRAGEQVIKGSYQKVMFSVCLDFSWGGGWVEPTVIVKIHGKELGILSEALYI